MMWVNMQIIKEEVSEGIVENGATMAGKIYRYENFAGLGYKSREMSAQ